MKNPTEPKNPPEPEKKPTLVSNVVKETTHQLDPNQAQLKNEISFD